MFSRRQLLASAALLPLASCATPTPTPGPTPTPNPCPVPQNIFDDMKALLVMAQNAEPGLPLFLPAGVVARIQSLLAIAVSTEQAVETSCMAGGSVSDLIARFVQVAKQILGEFGTNLPSWLSPAVAAAEVVINEILAYLGVQGRRAVNPAQVQHARDVLLRTRPPAHARRFHRLHRH